MLRANLLSIFRMAFVPGLLALVSCDGAPLNLGNNGAFGLIGGELFIQAVFLPVPATNGTCDYTASVTELTEGLGALDVSFTDLSVYAPTLLVGNQGTDLLLVQGAVTQIASLNGNPSLAGVFMEQCANNDAVACSMALSLDPSEVSELLSLCEHVQAACTAGKAFCAGFGSVAECAASAPTLQAPVNPFSTLETGSVEPAQNAPSYGSMEVTLVDGQTVNLMRAYFEGLLAMDPVAAFTTNIQLVTSTQLRATTRDGAATASNVFGFPVTFGFGNLVPNLGMAADGSYCVTPSPAMTITTCVPGQDALETVARISGVPSCSSVDAGVAGDGGGDAG